MHDLEKIKNIFAKGKYIKVIKLLKEVISSDKNNLEAIYLLALSLEKNSNFDESIKIYNRLLKKGKNSLVYDRLGEVHIKINNFHLAKNYFIESLKINNNNPTTLNNLGIVLAQLGKEIDSINYFKKAIAINKDYLDPIYNLLEIYEKTNNYKNLKSLILNYK